MADRTPTEQLVKYLTDVHSIEEQAIVQLRKAPDIAGDEGLAAVYREHLAETERHERLVRGRLEAHGADPSRTKDLAGQAGGLGMLLFARTQPDTPTKLAAHAFSYEHMELAAYELLGRAARLAGDEETARVAQEIAGEERAMGERLGDGFDAAVEAALREVASGDLDDHVDHGLADVHALEQQAIQLLEAAPGMVQDEGLAALLGEHLEESRRHRELVEERLEARGSSRSRLKDVLLRVGGLNVGGFFGAQPDTTAKLAGFAYAFEHIEIGAYEIVLRVASRAGDGPTVATIETILDEERSAATRIAATWDRTMAREMHERTTG